MKKLNNMLRRCKTLSRQLGRTNSYSSLRSQSTADPNSRSAVETGGIMWNTTAVSVYGGGVDETRETVFVGKTRKRYVIGSKYLSHPVVNALIETSSLNDGGKEVLVIKCEVVLFDHLLWMLENSDFNPNLDSSDELANLYLS